MLCVWLHGCDWLRLVAWLRSGEGIGWHAAGTIPNSLYRVPFYIFLARAFFYCSLKRKVLHPLPAPHFLVRPATDSPLLRLFSGEQHSVWSFLDYYVEDICWSSSPPFFKILTQTFWFYRTYQVHIHRSSRFYAHSLYPSISNTDATSTLTSRLLPLMSISSYDPLYI